MNYTKYESTDGSKFFRGQGHKSTARASAKTWLRIEETLPQTHTRKHSACSQLPKTQ